MEFRREFKVGDRVRGICEECKIEYEYEYNPKFPRKYCPACSAKKKAEFEGKTQTIYAENPVPVEKPYGTRAGEKPGVSEKESRAHFVAPKTPNAYPKDPVGLAVDIFVELCKDPERNRQDLMVVCTDLVKQAQEAFS